jgi:hypothetical protein
LQIRRENPTYGKAKISVVKKDIQNMRFINFRRGFFERITDFLRRLTRQLMLPHNLLIFRLFFYPTSGTFIFIFLAKTTKS